MGKSNEVTHYMSFYGYVPLWVLVNILTLGEISHFYLNMKLKDKIMVSKKFSILPNEMEKYMKNLTLARNQCAHDERFYDFKYKSNISIKNISKYSVLRIPSKNENPAYGINDAYSIAIILSLILSKNDSKEFVMAMDKEFKLLNKKLPNEVIDQIMQKMGFGSSWKNLPQLK